MCFIRLKEVVANVLKGHPETQPYSAIVKRSKTRVNGLEGLVNPSYKQSCYQGWVFDVNKTGWCEKLDRLNHELNN